MIYNKSPSFVRTKIKICGITRLEDAQASIQAGADAIGFMFFKESPRWISPGIARGIVDRLPPFTTCVGVFVNETVEEIRRVAALCGLGAVQLHGEESPSFCAELKGLKVVKAFRVRDRSILNLLPGYRTDAWLLDAYSSSQRGGTGATFNWEIARDAVQLGTPVLLAGGLSSSNVAEAIRQVRPHAVDVSSGVESAPGIKDAIKVQSLARCVAEADEVFRLSPGF